MWKKIFKNKSVEKDNLSFYESIYEHIIYIDQMVEVEDILSYKNNLQTYINGYTPDIKMFKQLRKVMPSSFQPKLVLFQQFITDHLIFLEKKKFKRLEDYLYYAGQKSKLVLFLKSITDVGLNQQEFIVNLANFEAINELMLKLPTLNLNNLNNLPLQLLEDYGISYGLNGLVMMDLNYTHMFDFLYKKIQQNLMYIKNYFTLLKPEIESLMMPIINTYHDKLVIEIKILYKEIKHHIE